MRYMERMEWITTQGLTTYPDALATMAARVEAVQQGQGGELIWLVEHPPLYTAGTSAKAGDLLMPSPPVTPSHDGVHLASAVTPERWMPSSDGMTASGGFPVYPTGRGGQYTYHGPGQRVAYLMLDLNTRGRDLRAYVKQLEQWVIDALADFGVEGFIREGRVGVWVDVHAERMKRAGANPCASLPPRAGGDGGGSADSLLNPHGQSTALPHPASPAGGGGVHEAKIAAIGVRVQKWVTSHGICLNVHPDLSHYAGIVPCGIREYGVTSLQALGVDATMQDVDAALKRHCPF